MTIKTKLLFSILITVLLIATVSFVIYQAIQRIDREIKKTEVTQKIVQVSTSRRGLILDYYNYHEERPKAQWQLLLDAQTKLIQSPAFDTPYEHSVLKRINETSELVKSIFTELVANYEKPKLNQLESEFFESLDKVLISRLLTETQTNISRAYSLAAESLGRVKTSQYTLVFAVVVGMIIGLLFFIALYFLFNQFIAKPLIALKETALRIASLDFSSAAVATTTATGSNDEIGQLARAFNKMAGKLKKSYRDLEGKVRDRTQDLGKYKLAIDNASDQIIITDPEATVLYINNATEKITGYTQKEAIGKKAGKLWGNLMERSFYEKLWKTIKIDKKTFTGEITNRRKNNQTYTAIISISPIFDKNGEIEFFVGIERDVTKEREVDKAKTEFVSLASHQLRTPLSTVSWYTEMLLAGDAGKVTADQKKYLEEIYTGNQRMAGLVNALLNVSSFELGTFVVEPEPTDASLLTRGVMDEQKPQTDKKKITISSSFEKNIPLIQADPKLLHMVVQNLLSNAVKYTPESGNIEVALSLDSKKKDILLKISDTGCGIPKNQQDKIFTKLFRADNVREKDTEGTGLGLYIVKAIIDHAGGKIWFESEENKGTTFYAALPLEGMKKKEGIKSLS